MSSKRIFVGNVPESTTADQLKQEFSNYGRVQNVDLKSKHNPLTDTTSHFAFITLAIEADPLRQCKRFISGHKPGIGS
jgi:RNA recognition motif-containing protein